MVSSRPAIAAFPARIAMKARHATELANLLAGIMRAALASRDRRRQLLQRQLESFDVGRRLAGIRTRLVAADGRLLGAIRGHQHDADRRLRGCAGRLETLSPLAVLGRGYAVCWNADRTRALRDAADVVPGDSVRVTLATGELDCEVRSTADNHNGHQDHDDHKDDDGH